MARTDLVAVVELGSTAVRCVLARRTPGRGYKVIAEERESTRLGSGAPGVLSRDAIDDTLHAVHRFFKRHSLDDEKPRVVAVATSAVRDARNRNQLLRPLRRDEGLDVRVLSAREEARLGTQAVLKTLAFKDGLVADLGGASLQLTRARDRKIVSIATRPLGAVRMTDRFLRHDPPEPRELRALRSEIRRQLVDAVPAASRGEIMVGLGGIVRTLASIHVHTYKSDRKRHGLKLRQSDITAIRERLESLSVRKRRKIRGLRPERADIILAGAIVIEEVMTFGGYLKLLISMRGVRDGILLHETFDGRRR